MSDWIRLNTEKLNAEREEEIGGVLVRTRLSPYDVPIAARGAFSDTSLRIDFQYLDDEPQRIEPQEDGVIMRVGRHSGRLFGIDVPRAKTANHSVNQLRDLIVDTVRRFDSQPGRRDSLKISYSIAADVISDQPELLAAS